MIINDKYNFTTIEKAFRDMQSVINNCTKQNKDPLTCKDDATVKKIQDSIFANAIEHSHKSKTGGKKTRYKKNKKRIHSYKNKR